MTRTSQHRLIPTHADCSGTVFVPVGMFHASDMLKVEGCARVEVIRKRERYPTRRSTELLCHGCEARRLAPRDLALSVPCNWYRPPSWRSPEISRNHRVIRSARVSASQ